MNNAELLKKMIADISNDPKYFGKVYEFDNILFYYIKICFVNVTKLYKMP